MKLDLIQWVSRLVRNQVECMAMLQLAAKLLIFSVAVCGFPAMLQTQDKVGDADELAKLRDILCREAWANVVKLGPKDHPIPIEGRTLVFYNDGTVLQTITDDTGIHMTRGTWRLESSPDGATLTVEGDGLHILRGRCPVIYDRQTDVMEFPYSDKDQSRYPAYRFEHVKGQRPPAPATPNKR